MVAVALFGVQIAAQTRDNLALWKIVPISNINHYHKTHLDRYFIFYFHFGHCHNLGKFVRTNKNCLGLCLKTDMDLNHWSNLA